MNVPMVKDYAGLISFGFSISAFFEAWRSSFLSHFGFGRADASARNADTLPMRISDFETAGWILRMFISQYSRESTSQRRRRRSQSPELICHLGGGQGALDAPLDHRAPNAVLWGVLSIQSGTVDDAPGHGSATTTNCRSLSAGQVSVSNYGASAAVAGALPRNLGCSALRQSACNPDNDQATNALTGDVLQGALVCGCHSEMLS